MLVKYTIGQLFGWACDAIVYLTPAVGIRFRSFNHLFYALVSLVVCLIPVVLYRNEPKRPTRYNKCIAFVYWLRLTRNVAVLLIGTLLYLISIFRSCRCMSLSGALTRLLEMNTQAEQAVHNAALYWRPVEYVAFISI